MTTAGNEKYRHAGSMAVKLCIFNTYIHTYMTKSDFHRLFDSGFAPSALSLRLNYHKLIVIP